MVLYTHVFLSVCLCVCVRVKGTVDPVSSRGSGEPAERRHRLVFYRKSQFVARLEPELGPCLRVRGAPPPDGFLAASERKDVAPGLLLGFTVYIAATLPANAPHASVVRGHSGLRSWHCSCVNPEYVGV